ncbi:hypothetical protein Tco_1310917 [Tanacetum coccineum]
MPRRELLQWSSPPPQNFDFKVLILKEPRNLAADHLPIGKPACVHGNEALEILPKLATRPTGRHHGANLTAKRSLTPERIKKTKRSKNDQKPTRNERDKNKSEESAKDHSRIRPTQQERQSKEEIIKSRAISDKLSKFEGSFEFQKFKD